MANHGLLQRQNSLLHAYVNYHMISGRKIYFLVQFLENKKLKIQTSLSKDRHCWSERASEWTKSGLMSHQSRGHTETGPRFKVSSERPDKRAIDLAISGWVV